uniref:H(+)-transporting two-sector ATPase n=1 Tax=Monomastix sp. (strain OKE-1) TaxID=141716 RepID=U5YGF1_MONSK|nr:ATP synthase F0 subunit 8 [Monomastix sp. OKE-1]AGZ90195.1 ATP synthase F0 subunit 8 [Monomastix sp. OKE-1]
MPQLDQLTFFSQFFWLCFFYLGFYLVLVKYFLPKMSKILKVRNMKMNSGNAGQTDFLLMKEENEKVKKMRDEALSEAFKESKHFLNESYQKTSSWVSKILQDINKKKLQKMNKTYIHSVQNLSFAQTLTLHNLKTVIAPSSYKASGIASLSTSESVKTSKDIFFNTVLLKSLTRKKAGLVKPTKK